MFADVGVLAGDGVDKAGCSGSKANIVVVFCSGSGVLLLSVTTVCSCETQ